MSNNLDLYQNRVRDSKKISKSKLIDTKVKTFKRALESSYNSEEVATSNNSFKALISGVPTSPKIAKKNFATLLENNCKVGDEIYWQSNNSHWIISEHDDTEVSIFQGSIQKALYLLKWKDPLTDEIYEARACAKGPDETVIGDGVKHSIMFDTVTDSLYLIVSAKKRGVNLLKRYFEIMVNGKKWEIQVVDNFTSADLLYLQLLEEPIDRDSDTIDLVDGKKDSVFIVRSFLDDVSSIVLGTEISFKPILFKNDSVFSDEIISITTDNCTYSNDLLSFDKLGTSSITVKFVNYDKFFTWDITVSEEVTDNIIKRDILGSETLKTLNTATYEIINTIDGISQNISGRWNFDDLYFTKIEENNNKIILKAKNKTGTTLIEFITEDSVITKDIKIVPLFGGI